IFVDRLCLCGGFDDHERFTHCFPLKPKTLPIRWRSGKTAALILRKLTRIATLNLPVAIREGSFHPPRPRRINDQATDAGGCSKALNVVLARKLPHAASE